MTPAQKPFLKQRNLADPQFIRDVADFFAGRRSGHLSKWLYSSPEFEGDKARGADEWKHVIERAKNGSDYYVFLKEKGIIRLAVSKLRDIFGQKARLIDLGPGSIDAVRDKILPFVRAYDTVQEYVGVDICANTLQMAKAEMAFLKASTIEDDFIQGVFKYGAPVDREVAAIFGLTLCNMAIDPRVAGLSEQLLSSYFKRLKSHYTAKEKFLLVTQDINQDSAWLARAYGALADHHMCVLHRIQRDLPISAGFDPDAFHIEVDFFANTQACASCFVPDKNMSFSIDGEQFDLKKGQRLYFHNAFKFDEKTFLSAAQKAGFGLVESIREQGNPCIFHALKVQ